MKNIEEKQYVKKELDHLKEEIVHEKKEIGHQEEEIQYEKGELKNLEKKVEELEREISNSKPHDHKLDLIFIVNGDEVCVENVNPNEPLKDAAEAALKESGNTGRPISDWVVTWDGKTLDLLKKVEDFHFSNETKLFMNLKAGVGGN